MPASTGLGFHEVKRTLRSRSFHPTRRRGIDSDHSNYPSKLALDLYEYVTSIGVFSKYSKGYDVRMGGTVHGYLLHYVHKGELQHVVGGKTYRVGQGGAFWMDCSKPHRHFNAAAVTADLWWVCFDGRNVPRLWAELGADQNPIFDGLNRERFETLFEELWTMVVKRPLACEARCHVTLNAILVELMLTRVQHARVASLVDQKSLLSDKVRRAVEIFERNYYYPKLGLKEVGDRVGTDIFQLSRKFRQEVGMPPIQYLNRYRVEHARHLLQSTGEPVKKITGLVGITDPDYFARLFRKITGLTPRDYRRKKNRLT